MGKVKEGKANPSKSGKSSYAKLKKIWDEKGWITTKETMEILWDTYGEEMDKMGK